MQPTIAILNTAQPSPTSNPCQNLLEQGQQAIEEGAWEQAINAFAQAYHMAETLQLNPTESSPIDILLLAAGHLTQLFIHLKQPLEAEYSLTQAHLKLQQVCCDEYVPRKLRIDALSRLDESLFALTAFLGQQGKLKDLKFHIAFTEQTADYCQTSLWQ